MLGLHVVLVTPQGGLQFVFEQDKKRVVDTK